MMFLFLSEWWRFFVIRYQAKRWLSRNDERLVAYCMFRLNRYARRKHPGYRAIYSLKNRLVRDFYDKGFCQSLMLQHQDLVCWGCSGEGGVDGRSCGRCGGSGVYRTVELIGFVFNVRGRTYVWHQPASLVKWPYVITESTPGIYKSGSGAGGFYIDSDDLRFLYVAVVHQYLSIPFPAFGFWQSLKYDLADNPMLARVKNFFRRKVKSDGFLSEDEISF